MHSRITFYVNAKIGQVNGRPPLESATVDKWLSRTLFSEIILSYSMNSEYLTCAASEILQFTRIEFS